ncbi:MAG: hypothetical protein JNK04_17350 [Myxococcales bacterium]|nr:hypothetical protein [Myxococcales bacterium]
MTDRPWTDDQARWVFRGAGTLARAGAEPVGPLVLPTAEFFPDRFDGSVESVGKLLDRLKAHVGFSDVPTALLLTDPEDGSVVSSCSSGGCSSGQVKTLSGQRVTAQADGGYAVQVATSEIKNPTVLTTVLARAMGWLFLAEADVMAAFRAKERGAAGDLAATMLGLGVLVANGSGIEVKGCGGMKIHSATSMGAAEATLALAIAVEREKLLRPGKLAPTAAMLKGLDPVPRALFATAAEYVAANRAIVRSLDDAPDTVAAGTFSLKEPQASITGRLGRWLGLGGNKDADPLDELEREAALSAIAPSKRLHSADASGQSRRSKNDARLAEIRALVDESFE